MRVAATSTAVPPPIVSAKRVALIVAFAHAVNDAYASFLPPLLPRIMDRLGLSIALAATIAVTFAVAASLLQPLLGWMADQYGKRIFLVLGPVATGVFVSLIGFAPGFWTLIALLTLGGLGSAAFHPPGASYAARVAEGKGSGARYSVFSFGGSVGYAMGPLVAVGLVQWRGLEGLWLAMIPVVVLAPFFYWGLPSGRAERAVASAPPGPRDVMRQLAGPLGLIFGISAAIAFVQRAFLTMEPIIVSQAGGSETLGAVVLTVYLGAQAGGTVAGGLLSDHMDKRRLLQILCTVALPVYVAAVWFGPSSALGLILAGCAGFVGMATLPPIVVMAQEIVPGGTAVSSGIVMGLAWATGSLGVLVTGAAADVIGPRLATLASMPMLAVAVVLAFHPTLRRVAAVTSAK